MAPKFLGCNRGTISIKRIMWDWTWQLNTLGRICRLAQVERATSATPRQLKHIALARWHRAGSIFLNEKKNEKRKKTRKNWASYVTLSWRTNVKAKKRAGMMTAHRVGSRACSWLNFFALFFSFFWGGQKIEPATRRWATEPATREWWICTVRDRWIFQCSPCSSNESNYWLILAPYEIK